MLKLFRRNVPKDAPLVRLKSGLGKTRRLFSETFRALLSRKKAISQETLDDLETVLIQADVGVEITQYLIDALTKKLSSHQLNDGEALLSTLKSEMIALLQPIEQPLAIEAASRPFVILVIGVNGAGKTTTIGKLASHFQQAGKKVMLAAGDTFRAAAVEQLAIWGERNGIPVIAQQNGADSASVIFDAVTSASARGIDVLLADTAGRLHTQNNLMEELKKIIRVIKKLDAAFPQEVLLVLDASVGQHGLAQAKQFSEAVGLSGIVMTKLDGSAKGGIIFSIAKQLGLPIRFIGVGEQIEDLQPFCAREFVEALLEI